jgi:large subunit ribosomal protein L15
VKLNDLKPAPGSKKTRKRAGRGMSSGRGKTAGRGEKGQKSRSGFSQGAGWEGGRSRLIMRLPKRGFNRVGVQYQLVNLHALNAFDEGAIVDPTTLRAMGIIRHVDRPVKLLGDGELEVKGLLISVDACSRAAGQAVRAAGGTVEVAVPSDAEEAAEPSGADAAAEPSGAEAAAAAADDESAQDDDSAVDDDSGEEPATDAGSGEENT